MEQHVPPSPLPVGADLAAPSRERAARRAVKATRDKAHRPEVHSNILSYGG
jgi:hypothetical protein